MAMQRGGSKQLQTSLKRSNAQARKRTIISGGYQASHTPVTVDSWQENGQTWDVHSLHLWQSAPPPAVSEPLLLTLLLEVAELVVVVAAGVVSVSVGPVLEPDKAVL